jgi:hypothetical protein
VSQAHVNGVVDPSGSENGAGLQGQPSAVPFDFAEVAASRPEVAVGAAFVGGFLLALLLRRVRS